ATFTSNRAAAAPVVVSRGHLRATGGRAAAIVLNSGNANAATGAPGLEHAERTCSLVAAGLGVAAEEVLVASTGLIGIPLPSGAIESGVGPLVAALSRGARAGAAAARAIMTTDSRPKQVRIEGPGWTVGGIAKGAAMLAPDMATMIAVLTTDAVVIPAELGRALRRAVSRSFNELSVDGCCSTNDTVVVLANGRSGRQAEGGPGPFADALSAGCADLAEQMAADAEGRTVVARVTVTGAASDAEAARATRQVAESQLVQCSLHGADPYWGRVVSELGAAGVAFELDRVSVAYGGVVVCRGGMAARHDPGAVAHHLGGERVEVTADLGLGAGAASILTTDLSPAYIAENMRTS
ncbi:MAG: bifunctional glutamate N-acetyltransferase/amino-acid acetyltransferase ArgJ, partial [Acidimicrobiales bacterium]